MKNLSEADVIRIMGEEWDKKIKRLSEEVSIALDGEIKGDIVSPELKILHKNSGIRYTVDSVGPRDAILRTPEGEQFIVDKDELQQNYELA
jgi:hypothetical protein